MHAVDAPGWAIRSSSNVYFVGDTINITLTSPGAFRGYALLKITDPNGSAIEGIYIRLVNGSASFVHELPLDAMQGQYSVVATVNENPVAAAEFSVIYDEVNYLGKRVTLMEQQAASLQYQVNVERTANRELREQYGWTVYFLWLSVFVVAFILTVTFWFPIGTMARLLLKWKYPLDENLRAHERALRAIANPPGSSEIAPLFPNRRGYRPGYFTDPIYLNHRRLAGLPDPPIQLTAPWLNPREPRAPIRKIARPVRPVRPIKPGGGKK